MIDKELLTKVVREAMAGTDLFLTGITVRPGNSIEVLIDSPTGVDIDTCAAITRRIEETFDRDVEDYELEVGSAGITSDFRVRGQYEKNLGNDVEVLTKDGRKLRGVLTAVAEGGVEDTDVAFTIEVPVKVKEEGAKRPVVRQEPMELTADQCKYVRYDLKF